MDASFQMHETVCDLTMLEIETTLPEGMFSQSQKCTCMQMEAVAYGISDENWALLVDAAHTKRLKQVHQMGNAVYSPTVPQPTGNVLHHTQSREEDRYLSPVSEECRHLCLSKFIDTTSQQATLTFVCSMCAGRFFCSKTEMMTLMDVQGFQNLCPSSLHDVHVLTDGMLLHHSSESMYKSKKRQSLHAHLPHMCQCSSMTQNTFSCFGQWNVDWQGSFVTASSHPP